MIKVCEYCNNEFNTQKKKTRFCSRQCSSNSRKKQVCVSCENCNKEFYRPQSQVLERIFCSKECYHEYKEKNHSITFNCYVCDKEVTTTKSRYDKAKYHFCSYECSDIGQSLFFSGENNPRYLGLKYKCDYCNNEFGIKKSSLDSYKNHFCSKGCKDKWQGENVRGENHPNYNPNIPLEERKVRRMYTEYWDWRKKVYERDSYTCQCCGDSKGGNLVAHHILNYHSHQHLRTNVDNGITLCDKCHREFHSIYGNINNNKSQIDNFIYMKNIKAS